MQGRRVLVWGSINLDVQLSVAEFPRPGETITALDYRMGLGGKGANQAVAAARAGADTKLGGRVGTDGRALEMLRHAAPALDLAHVAIDDTKASGAAYILISQHGENQIVVVAGANAHVDKAGFPAPASGDIALAQLEIPVASVEAFFTASRDGGCTTVLNAAPAIDEARTLFPLTDILVVNETELSFFAGAAPPHDIDGIATLATAIIAGGTSHIVVTLGARGAIVVDQSGWTLTTGRPARAIDTTGAGDCFCGVMCAELAFGQPIQQAVAIANNAASLQVERRGAADAMPYRQEITTLLPAD